MLSDHHIIVNVRFLWFLVHEVVCLDPTRFIVFFEDLLGVALLSHLIFPHTNKSTIF